MNPLRKLLFPFSLLYDGVTKSRNALYDKGILKENEYDIPVIVVGNLRVGGTGKTPMVAYLVQLLKENYPIAVLSRGYKRKTKGFVLANAESTVADLGDESFQLYRNFPEIMVAVDEERAHGIETLMQLPTSPQVILLDDAFQHRSVKAGFNILLTSYDDLYVDDQVLPAGNLRENVSGAARAQVIVVTKCPEQLTEQEEFETAQRLKPALHQTVFFSKIIYNNFIQNSENQITLKALKDYKIVLVTGIANPKPLEQYLIEQKIDFFHLSFPDHYNFTDEDFEKIYSKFNNFDTNKKLILTTEKDYVRIFAILSQKMKKADDWYYLVITTQIMRFQNNFNQLILNYVGQSTRDRSIFEK
jgi:tetraacyldisaccharide 4'-kinase